MNTIRIKPEDIRARSYEELIKTTWWNDFREDFLWEHFSSKSDIHNYDILIIEEDSIFVGGAVVADDTFINKYSSPWKIKYKEFLQKKWYKSLAYLIILPEYRKKGAGSKILEYILANYDKIWLSYEPGTIPFYEGWWFKAYLDPVTRRATWIMINK